MKLGRIDTSKPVCVGIGWNYLGVSVSKGVSPKQIAIVDYLCLATEPYLCVNECSSCGARYFDRRNACANCGLHEFSQVRIANSAILKAFSIVHNAAPGIQVPFVSAIVETQDGTSVRANIVDLDDPMKVELGMRLGLTTYVCGIDNEGTECVAFGYTPVT